MKPQFCHTGCVRARKGAAAVQLVCNGSVAPPGDARTPGPGPAPGRHGVSQHVWHVA